MSFPRFEKAEQQEALQSTNFVRRISSVNTIDHKCPNLVVRDFLTNTGGMLDDGYVVLWDTDESAYLYDIYNVKQIPFPIDQVSIDVDSGLQDGEKGSGLFVIYNSANGNISGFFSLDSKAETVNLVLSPLQKDLLVSSTVPQIKTLRVDSKLQGTIFDARLPTSGIPIAPRVTSRFVRGRSGADSRFSMVMSYIVTSDIRHRQYNFLCASSTNDSRESFFSVVVNSIFHVSADGVHFIMMDDKEIKVYSAYSSYGLTYRNRTIASIQPMGCFLALKLFRNFLIYPDSSPNGEQHVLKVLNLADPHSTPYVIATSNVSSVGLGRIEEFWITSAGKINYAVFESLEKSLVFYESDYLRKSGDLQLLAEEVLIELKNLLQIIPTPVNAITAAYVGFDDQSKNPLILPLWASRMALENNKKAGNTNPLLTRIAEQHAGFFPSETEIRDAYLTLPNIDAKGDMTESIKKALGENGGDALPFLAALPAAKKLFENRVTLFTAPQTQIVDANANAAAAPVNPRLFTSPGMTIAPLDEKMKTAQQSPGPK